MDWRGEWVRGLEGRRERGCGGWWGGRKFGWLERVGVVGEGRREGGEAEGWRGRRSRALG